MILVEGLIDRCNDRPLLTSRMYYFSAHCPMRGVSNRPGDNKRDHSHSYQAERPDFQIKFAIHDEQN